MPIRYTGPGAQSRPICAPNSSTRWWIWWVEISGRNCGIRSTIPTGEIVPLAPPRKTAVRKTTPRKTAPQPAELPLWQEAVAAAEDKQARDLQVLDLREITSFADYFIICHGTNPRQNQAISDEIEIRLKHLGRYPASIEGYDNAEWILLDYGDFLVHVFSEKAREYYDLERLWRDAKVISRS